MASWPIRARDLLCLCYNYSVDDDDYGDECDKMVAMMSYVHYTSSPFLLLSDKYFVIKKAFIAIERFYSWFRLNIVQGST